MIEYSKNKREVNLQRLSQEVKSGSQELKDKYSHITVQDNNISFGFTESLTQESLNLLEQVYLAHDASIFDLEKIIENRILLSMQYGRLMMAKFGAENKAMVARGELSSNDLFTLSFVLKDIQLLVISGSLEMAQFAWNGLPIMDGLPLERKQKYARLLAEYLEIIRNTYPIPGEGY